VLDDAAEARLTERLAALRRDDRVEVAVVTLDRLAFLAFVAAAFAWVGWRGRAGLGDLLARVRPCPACGGRGVVVERATATEPGETTEGAVTITRRCPSCGWHRDRGEAVPSLARQRARSSGGGGFGGGQSSGGGASGRW